MQLRMARRKTQKQQIKEILQRAEEKGVSQNFFFKTTLDRYLTQIQILESLKAEIAELGATVSKEYVKGRKNLYSNPAITEYNRTATAANNTVVTLTKIIDSFKDDKQEKSKLEEFMASVDTDD
jgi:hypothetical protein